MKQKINRDTNVDLMQVALELVKKTAAIPRQKKSLNTFLRNAGQ